LLGRFRVEIAASMSHLACRGIPILLVDDDSHYRAALADLLRQDGHVVVEVETPLRAPPLEQLGQVCIVIADLEVWGKNGILFADRFHAARPDVPIILLTSHPAPVVQRRVRTPAFVLPLDKMLEYGSLHRLLHDLVAGGDACREATPKKNAIGCAAPRG
jgi:DNA-binding NtrC family response regulator